jgi:GNAT superfamily N-acetyltransferase
VQPWTPEGHAALQRPGVEHVRRLEDLSHRSWPPLLIAPLGGWTLRAGAGITRRINSAWPRKPCTLTPPQLLTATKTWYAQQGLPPMIQLSPANEPVMAPHLEGWAISGEALVLEGPLTAAASAQAHVDGWPGADWWSVVTQTAAHQFGDGRRSAAEAILRKITKPSGYAVVYDGGQPVAVGRGVVDGRSLGVFTIGTLEAHRGRGHGRTVLGALGAWAAGLGATTTWLQVEADNTAARALYADLREVYSYAYASWSSSDR